MACRELFEGVTFRDFAALARMKGWTAEGLGQEFPGVNSPEPSVAYFGRVLHGRAGWDSVIPYRRVIEKYVREARLLIADNKLRACGCGCGSPLLFPRLRFAHETNAKLAETAAADRVFGN